MHVQFAGILQQAPLDRLSSGVECSRDVLVLHLAGGFVELARHQWLARLEFRNGLLHLLQQAAQPLALLGQIAGNLAAAGRLPETAVGSRRGDRLLQPLIERGLSTLEFPRFFRQAFQPLADRFTPLLAEAVTQLFEPLLSAGPGGGCRASLVLLQRLRRPLHLLTHIVQLLSLACQAFLVLRPGEFPLQVIDIAEQLLLFLLQALQLPADLLLPGGRCLGFQCRLEIANLLVQIMLTPRQLAEPIEHLPVLLGLGRVRLVLCQLRLLVPLIRLFEVELVKLTLLALRTVRLCRRLALAAILAGHPLLAGPQLEQGLPRRPGVDQRLGEGFAFAGLGGTLQLLGGPLHGCAGLGNCLLQLSLLGLLAQFVRLVEHLPLRLGHFLDVRRELLAGHRARFTPDDVPGGADNLFLQFGDFTRGPLRVLAAWFP